MKSRKRSRLENAVTATPPETLPLPGQVEGNSVIEGNDDDDHDLASEFPNAEVVVPYKSNILRSFNRIMYDRAKERFAYENEARKLAVKANLQRFQPTETVKRFGRRVTEISWHPNEPYLVAAADKFGDLLLLKGFYDTSGDLKFCQRLAMKGCGPSGAVFSIRFEESRRNLCYTAGLDSMVNCFDMHREGALVHEFYNTGDYHHWFTSMDVSQPTRTLLAGCTKGYVYLSTLDGEKVAQTRLHKGKVFHVEFNQAVPHLIVTSSIDKTVKLWDLRKLSENNPLTVLKHDKPVNVAHFNPLNSSRLLTSDQRYDIRIYRGPNWDQQLCIKHPHRQFQHLTPIVAKWHPLSDIIVIGKYPVVPKGTKTRLLPPRPIQFFDADSGNMIHQLSPPTNEIVSLNVFNPLGDILASGQSRSLIFFNQQEHSQVLSKNAKGRKRSENDVDFGHRLDSDSEGDDDDEGNDFKKTNKRKPKSSVTEQKVKNAQPSAKKRKR